MKRLALALVAALALFSSEADANEAAKRDETAKTRPGIAVRFDGSLGLHVAVDQPGVFRYRGRFYRRHAGAWQVSARGDGGWSPIGMQSVPASVRKTRGASRKTSNRPSQ
jgi:hypothetical protein